MTRHFSLVAVPRLLVVAVSLLAAGCSVSGVGDPGQTATSLASTTPATSPDETVHDPASNPSPTPTEPTEVVSAEPTHNEDVDPRAEAQEYLRTTTGGECFGEAVVEPLEDHVAELLALAEDADEENWVEPERAWLGSLEGAIGALGGTFIASDGRSAWISSRSDPDVNWPTLEAGTPMVEELVLLRTESGKSLWYRTGNSIVLGTCG